MIGFSLRKMSKTSKCVRVLAVGNVLRPTILGQDVISRLSLLGRSSNADDDCLVAGMAIWFLVQWWERWSGESARSAESSSSHFRFRSSSPTSVGSITRVRDPTKEKHNGSVWLSVCLVVCLSVSVCVCLFACVLICVYLCVCLSVCLFV